MIDKNNAKSIQKYKPRSITPVDPIKHYIWEVNQYPLLSKEEEESLIKKYNSNKDVDAAKKLLMSHLRLVVKIAFKYYNQYFCSLFDLIQEGNLGIIMAIKKFNPQKNVRFATYAQWWIKAYILKYLMDNYSIIKIGHSRAEKRLFYTLKKAKEKLTNAGIDPDNTKMLADYMKENEHDIIEMDRRLNQGVISLDQPAFESSGQTIGNIIESKTTNLEQDMIQKDLNSQLNEKLKNFSKNLKGKELTIWENRLLSDDPWSLQKIGEMFSISRERVRQIEERLIKKLKDYLAKQKDFNIDDFIKSD